ncbi:MAG: hypothetical protein DRP47_00805 [Candidatus Zixiibacteriota bacterium]|nr:MAG: hypothetical protein DRP47_00805 [candidate division Zixibacteria bacterium]
MMQKRTLYSLLLTSFILVFAFTSAIAQEVTVDSKSVARCQEQSIDLMLTNPDAISAFEIILEVTSTSGGAFFTDVNVVWDDNLTVLTNRIIDVIAHYDGTPDTIRIAGMLIDAGDVCLDPSTDLVVGEVVFTTNDVCDGTIELAGTDFVYQSIPVSTASTQFVDCATTTLVPVVVNTGTVTVANQAPTIEGIADATLHWGTAYSGAAFGDDPDLVNGCEGITFSKGTPAPADLSVQNDGTIYWLTTGADVGNHEVTVVVTDECGATAQTTFFICVENTPPEITCPTDTVRIIWGETAGGIVTGFDPDGGPNSLAYSVAGFNGPGAPSINPATGVWEWVTIEDNPYLGLFQLDLAVTDGGNIDPPCAPANADTCSVYVLVIPTIRATIEKTHGTIQGNSEEVSIYLDSLIDPEIEMGGFDFLIHYDASALYFQSAVPGQMLVDCGWEYFTFRYGANGNCGPSACPSGVLRVVAMAETNNGANHPACFSADDPINGTNAGQLVSLSFLVTNDRTFECMYVPIRWIWYDCGDNTISSKSGDTLFLSDEVFDYDSSLSVHNLGAEFPSFYGANASCDTEDKYFPLRLVDFYNGGIDIVCADSIDGRGDLNLNGLLNEIADAVLYTNYFVYGLGVFNYVDAQTAASDVNADGIPLTVGDLVYQIRIIVGDAQAYPKSIAPTAVDMVINNGRMSITNNVPMGAAFVVAEGQVTPELLANDMDMMYAYDAANNQTRILVYSISTNSFTGEFLDVQGELVTVEMATYEGHPVKIEMIPSEFRLAQNYPNPFNPTTTISFDVPVATSYNLTIYNINGQEVERFAGTAEAGVFEVEWDASNVGSGVYFYRLEAGDFSATKKMVLVK